MNKRAIEHVVLVVVLVFALIGLGFAFLSLKTPSTPTGFVPIQPIMQPTQEPMCTDCDDNNPNVFPGAPEICNGIDDNCDNVIDEGGDALCDDGNACNGMETCQGQGGCQSGMSLVCDDQNPCTDDTCDPQIGCVFTPNTNSCDDNDACTSEDMCTDGVCLGTPTFCDDLDACTDNNCNQMSGECEFPQTTCNDLNDCTDDSCDSMTGCVFTPDNDNTCGNACFNNPFCDDGQCVGEPITCDDQNLCTIDTCDPITGCVFTPVACDDMNPCTDDACNPSTGDCEFTIDNTNNCVADEFFCTVDVCDDGECLPIDVNPCPCGCNEVTDSCNPCPPGGGGSGQSRGTPQAAKRCPGYCDLPQYRDYLTECLQCRQIPPPTIPQEEIAIGQTPTFAYFNIPPREQSEQQAARQPTLAGQAPSQRQPTRQTGPAMVYQEAQKPSYQSVGLAIGILLTFTILLYYAFFKRWH